jgi:hypothetical protein
MKEEATIEAFHFFLLSVFHIASLNRLVYWLLPRSTYRYLRYRTGPRRTAVSGVGEPGIAVPSTRRRVERLRLCLPSTRRLRMAFSSFPWPFRRRGSGGGGASKSAAAAQVDEELGVTPQLMDFLRTLSPDAFKSAALQLQGSRPLNHNPLRDSTPRSILMPVYVDRRRFRGSGRPRPHQLAGAACRACALQSQGVLPPGSRLSAPFHQSVKDSSDV